MFCLAYDVYASLLLSRRTAKYITACNVDFGRSFLVITFTLVYKSWTTTKTRTKENLWNKIGTVSAFRPLCFILSAYSERECLKSLYSSRLSLWKLSIFTRLERFKSCAAKSDFRLTGAELWLPLEDLNITHTWHVHLLFYVNCVTATLLIRTIRHRTDRLWNQTKHENNVQERKGCASCATSSGAA